MNRIKQWIKRVLSRYIHFWLTIAHSDEQVVKDARAREEQINGLREDNRTLHEDNKALREDNKVLHEDNKALHEDNKALHGELESLQEDVRSMFEFDHVMRISRVSGMSWEDAIKEYARCNEHNLKIDDYISFHAWDVDDSDIEELKKVIRLCRQREQWEHDYYIDAAFEKTGIDRKELDEKLRIVEAKGFNGLTFIKKSYFFWDVGALKQLRENEQSISETDAQVPEKIKADTGWTYGKYLLEFNKAQCICGCTEDEFLKYDIYKTDYVDAANYCSVKHGVYLFARYCDFTGPYRFFSDKGMFLEKFADFVNRRWFRTTGLDFEMFRHQTAGLNALIYKPLSSNQGNGICKFELHDDNSREVYDEIMRLGPGIVEECIVQHPLLASLGSSSVNSIRVLTFIDDGTVEILAAAIKTGISSVADNLAQGGLTAAIDIDTGEICTDGVNKAGEIYKSHPVSGTRFKGLRIPSWDKLLDTCKRAAQVVPKMKYIGWDISVTADDRITIIEGNNGPDMYLMQSALVICDNAGIRNRFDKYLWFDDSEQFYYMKALQESEMDYDEVARTFRRLSRKGISSAEIYSRKLYRKEPLVYSHGEKDDAAANDGYRINEAALEAAREKYELKRPSCYEKDVLTLKNIDEIAEPRFVMGDDGVYHSAQDKTAGAGAATIMFTGDNLCISPQIRAALDDYGTYNFRDSYYFVKKIFGRADCVVGNLETTLADSRAYINEQDKTDGKTNCNAPSSFLDAIRYAGFDLMVNSNNHNCDTGVDGIFETISHLDQYRLIHTGLFTGEEPQRFVIIDINGIRVGFLSYSTTFNRRETNLTREGQDVLLNRYSKERITTDVQNAKEAGAEYIIAYNHWGIEGDHSPSEEQKIQAQEMADAGVDYIIGSHPHVLQPYDVLKAADGRDVPVIFSMGNFVSAFNFNRFGHVRDSIVLKIRLKRGTNGEVQLSDDSYIPFYVYSKYGKRQRRYVAMPLINRYLNQKNREMFLEIYSRITSIMGSGIRVDKPLDFS